MSACRTADLKMLLTARICFYPVPTLSAWPGEEPTCRIIPTASESALSGAADAWLSGQDSDAAETVLNRAREIAAGN